MVKLIDLLPADILDEIRKRRFTPPGSALEAERFAPLGHVMRCYVNAKYDDTRTKVIMNRAACEYFDKYPNVVIEYKTLVEARKKQQANQLVEQIFNDFSNKMIYSIVRVDNTVPQAIDGTENILDLTKDNIAEKLRRRLRCNEDDLVAMNDLTDHMQKEITILIAFSRNESNDKAILHIHFLNF